MQRPLNFASITSLLTPCRHQDSARDDRHLVNHRAAYPAAARNPPHRPERYNRFRDSGTFGATSYARSSFVAAMKAIAVPALLVWSSLAAGAADWPAWRGPSFNGSAADATPPLKWSETESVKWKVKIPGRGNATPIVLGNQVFVLSAISTEPPPTVERPPAAQPPPPQDGPGGGPSRRRGPGGPGGGRSEAPTAKVQFTVLSLDRATGKILWQKTARELVPHEGHHNDGTFASCSPVTDGEHLFASFGSHGIYCYDLKGNLVWENDLGDMRTRNSFGEGASPALHGDTLVVNWDHEGEDFIVALDKRTGKERWRQSRDEATSWSTPLIVEHDGKAQVVVSATKRVRSYDLATGQQLWECGGMTDNVIPTPFAAFGMVYPISGFRGAALLAIKLGRTGDLTGTDAIAWQHAKGTPYVSCAVLAGERIYFCSGNNGIVSCFHAKTGAPLFEGERLADLAGGVYASPVAAADRVYLIGRDGKAVVLKQGDKLEVLATNKLDDRIDASPAIAGKELFLRGHQYLYCLAE
jgi:outer membrane protein assembly factor BamB